jgi:Fur family ferric uptake transcriptional regulator
MAEDLIRSTGERITSARIQILALLLAAPRALTHREIEDGLDSSLAIDRVTVYRVLEWLTDQHLAHKISADDRVWRFNAVPVVHDRQHAHFKCTVCGEVICLEDLAPDIRPRLPAGYAPQSLEVTIRGLCSACGAAPRRARKRAP